MRPNVGGDFSGAVTTAAAVGHAFHSASFHFSKKWHMGESDGIRLSFGYRNMARNGIFPCGDS